MNHVNRVYACLHMKYFHVASDYLGRVLKNAIRCNKAAILKPRADI